jgi:hypothetical protein
VNSLPTRIGLSAACGIVALIVLGTTLWFLGDALMLLLEEKGVGPPAAAGLTGIAGLVLAVVFGLLAKFALRSRRHTVQPVAAAAPGTTTDIAAELGALVAQQIVKTTRTHPLGTMGAALAAGLAVGALPELRKTLLGLFKQ